MGDVLRPRRGSMQFWPRKRARREYPRVKTPIQGQKEVKPIEFAGYKVGMTHVLVIDNKATSRNKGQAISLPVTIVECPPMKVVGIRCYTLTQDGDRVKSSVVTKFDKEVSRRLPIPKKDTSAAIAALSSDGISSVRLLVHTQPHRTSIGKKKPELFEIVIPGKPDEQLSYAKQALGKELHVKELMKEGQQVDVHAVTKGKGFQGPVKRFGVAIRSHKAEKTKRGPGSLGAWCGQQHMMYRVAHAGQMGYHTRTEWNKYILKIGDDPSLINPAGGFIRYGFVKNHYILVKGSLPGPSKRLIRFSPARRPDKKVPQEAPSIQYLSKISHQA